jgi:uncharacterized protein YjiS (DUF1127 family)
LAHRPSLKPSIRTICKSSEKLNTGLRTFNFSKVCWLASMGTSCNFANRGFMPSAPIQSFESRPAKLRGALAALRQAWARWRQSREQSRRLQQDRQQLLAMEAHELRDLGLGRDAVPYLTSPASHAHECRPAGAPSSAHEAPVARHHRQLDEA